MSKKSFAICLMALFLASSCGLSPQDKEDARRCSHKAVMFSSSKTLAKYSSGEERMEHTKRMKDYHRDMTVNCTGLSEAAYKIVFEDSLKSKIKTDPVKVSGGKISDKPGALGGIQYTGSVKTDKGDKRFIVYLSEKDGIVTNIAD